MKLEKRAAAQALPTAAQPAADRKVEDVPHVKQAAGVLWAGDP